MPADWYCEIEGQQQGPITSLQLKQLATAGKLQPASPVWKEGMQKKVPAQSVKGLFDSPAAAASAPAEMVRRPTTVAAPKKEAALVDLEMLTPAQSKGEELIELETLDNSVEEVEEVEEIEEVERPRKKKAAEDEDEDEDEDDRRPRRKRRSEDDEDEGDEDEEDRERRRKKKSSRSRKGDEDDGPAGEVLAELEIIYREGHPDLEEALEGMLILESTGLRFQFEDEDEFRVPFDKVQSVREPAKGDYSPSAKRKALGAKIGGGVGKLASWGIGKLIGGDAGNLVSKVGGAAGDMASKGGNLGKPPRNRITIAAQIRKKSCKLVFDVNGPSREEMNEETKVLYKQIQKARDKFTTALAAASTATEGETNINVVVNQSAEEPLENVRAGASAAPIRPAYSAPGGTAQAAPRVAGKPFRVRSGAQVRGPFSLEEIRRMLSSGSIGSSDLIGVETWLPVATLGGLLGSGSSAVSRGGNTGGEEGDAGGEEEAGEEHEEDTGGEEYGDFEEVSDDDGDSDEPEETAPASATSDGDGALPVDDEFNIG